MCRRHHALRSQRAFWLVFLAALFGVGFALGFRIGRHATIAILPESLPAEPRPAGPEPTGPQPARPEPAEPEPAGPEPARLRPDPEFDARLRAIAGDVGRIRELSARSDRERAAALDRDCAARVVDLVASRSDAGERTLELLATAPSPPSVALVTTARRVLQLECDRRAQPGSLIGAALRLVSRGGEVALVVDFLAAGDLLGVAHRAAVVAIAAREAVPEPLRLALLRAHWRTMRGHGARATARLTGEALLWRTHGNRCQRLVANEHLLTTSPRRSRLPQMLAHLLDTESDHFVRELSVTIAAQFAPTEAGDLLRRLSLGGLDLTAAWLTLGERDHDAVVDAYYTCLADAVGPRTRRDILTALGFVAGRPARSGRPDAGDAAPTASAPAALEFAATSEPCRALRRYALGLLSASAPTRFEAAAAATLTASSPGTPKGPDDIGPPDLGPELTMAIRNLITLGAVDAAARLATRLLRGRLEPEVRDRLEHLLREGLPAPMLQHAGGRLAVR